MALIGKIMTLFSDKDKTSPVFPRTKINAVSDENGIGLDAILDEVKDSVNRIDLSTYAEKSELGTQVTYKLNGTTLTITTK